MSVLQLFSNNGVSLLATAITPSDLTIVVQTGTGQHYPMPINPGEFFLVTLEDIASPSIREIVRIVGRAGDILIVDPSGRAQEQTIARSWLHGNTLVDHRVTAETMRQAFLQPVSTGGTNSSLIVADENITLTASPSKINFVGDGVTTTNIGTELTVTIPGAIGTGGSSLSGVPPVLVESGWTDGVTENSYSDTKRSFKYWVTLFDPAAGTTQAFEVFAVVQGLLGSNTETVTWTRSNRIGYNFLGQINLALDVSLRTLSISWTNDEPLANVLVSSTLLQ